MSDEKKKAEFFKRPRKGQSTEDVARDIANVLIAQINAKRAAEGLPPLPKTHK
jgi:hypothetical protein